MMSDSILIVSTNWIGDAVMGMPAVQRFRSENPAAQITVLAKPSVNTLWKMHPSVDFVQLMGKPLPTARKLLTMKYDCAYIFPNSFRSAVIPLLAGIPKRIGSRGHWRHRMLSKIIALPAGHQQFEYRNILGIQGEELPVPRIDVPKAAIQALEKKLKDFSVLENGAPLITLLPGAARGPSKRWPPEHFVELAKTLRDSMGARVVLGGGPADADACADIAEQSGGVSLAGKTSIPEWAALLKRSDCVVSNDSGGMHLATAVGTPVVGIYGLTDPSKTGPLGKSVVLQKSTLKQRDISRESEAAIQALASIAPAEVAEAVHGLLLGKTE